MKIGNSHPWLAAFLFSLAGNAATLKPETVAAWDNYVETAKTNLQTRIRPGGSFLWTLEDADRAVRVRSGEIVAAPAPGAIPKKVPGGLIHHWMGAMFLPNVTLDQVLNITRDYDHYKDYYQPAVVDSKTVAREDNNDQFSMRILNKAFFLKTALDADYRATTVRIDENRMYSISQTTRVQEIEDYGQPDQHKIPEGQGGGYIWRLFSMARFEQRDAGVYFEFEAVALSRDVPLAARLLVDPIVRRVSRNSLMLSLRQTELALRENSAVASKRTTVPTGIGRAETAGSAFR